MNDRAKGLESNPGCCCKVSALVHSYQMNHGGTPASCVQQLNLLNVMFAYSLHIFNIFNEEKGIDAILMILVR